MVTVQSTHEWGETDYPSQGYRIVPDNLKPQSLQCRLCDHHHPCLVFFVFFADAVDGTRAIADTALARARVSSARLRVVVGQ